MLGVVFLWIAVGLGPFVVRGLLGVSLDFILGLSFSFKGVLVPYGFEVGFYIIILSSLMQVLYIYKIWSFKK